MTRWIVGTLAAVGLAAGTATAEDAAQKLGRYRPVDDQQAVAPAAPTPADDTEQINHRYGGRGGYGYGRSAYYGGYRGYYGGGYRSYYGGGYRPYYYGGYRPYYGGFSFGLSYYGPSYYGSYYYPSPVYTPSYYGSYWGVSATPNSGLTVDLAMRPKAPTVVPANWQPGQPSQGTANGFRYDGGPSNPVPQPTPDVQGAPPTEEPVAPLAPRPTADSLKIVAKPGTIATKPVNRYKAYGEK